MEIYIPVGLAFVAVLVAAIWVGSAVVRVQQTASDRLAVYGRRDTSSRAEQLSQPFVERAMAPVVVGLGRFLRRFTPVGYLEKIEDKLVYAGNPANMDAVSFVTIKVALIIAGTVAAYFLRSSGDGITQLALILFPPIMGFFGPDAWLNRKIEERRLAMLRSLPDTLDLLVISVEAGLGFDSALSRVVTTVPGPLSEEFFRMLQETRVGVSRRDAMRHLMDRTDLDELRSFILAMLQAEAFGVAIARVLRVQADEMRVKRRQRAQEKAFAAPVKIVFPLVFCIFPALFTILLGPAAINISQAFT